MNKQDCKSIAQAELSLQEVLDYPSNKLHGSVMLKALAKDKSGIDTEKVIGSLDYWFKLHTAGIFRNIIISYYYLYYKQSGVDLKLYQNNFRFSHTSNKTMARAQVRS